MLGGTAAGSGNDVGSNQKFGARESGDRSPIDDEFDERARMIVGDRWSQFDDEDRSELASLRGVGGGLTDEGLAAAFDKIERKREIRRQFEAVLETHYFEALAATIEAMYRATRM
jgi:hypothetical protein